MLLSCKVVCCVRLQKEIDVVKNFSSIEKLRREITSFCFCGSMGKDKGKFFSFVLAAADELRKRSLFY